MSEIITKLVAQNLLIFNKLISTLTLLVLFQKLIIHDYFLGVVSDVCLAECLIGVSVFV